MGIFGFTKKNTKPCAAESSVKEQVRVRSQAPEVDRVGRQCPRSMEAAAPNAIN